MTYKIGDPNHIGVHNELSSDVGELASQVNLELDLPPQRNLGERGHTDDHNAIVAALDEISTDLALGKILQVVRAADMTHRSTTSTSWVDAPGMSVTIIPTADTSRIIVIAQFNGLVSSPSSGYLEAYYSITDSENMTVSGAESVVNATRDFTYTTTGTTVYHRGPKTLIAYASPASISAQTYKLRHRTVHSTNISSIANSPQTGQMYAIEVSA